MPVRTPKRFIVGRPRDDPPNPEALSNTGGTSYETLSVHRTHRHPHIAGADLLAPCTVNTGGGSCAWNGHSRIHRSTAHLWPPRTNHRGCSGSGHLGGRHRERTGLLLQSALSHVRFYLLPEEVDPGTGRRGARGSARGGG